MTFVFIVVIFLFVLLVSNKRAPAPAPTPDSAPRMMRTMSKKDIDELLKIAESSLKSTTEHIERMNKLEEKHALLEKTPSQLAHRQKMSAEWKEIQATERRTIASLKEAKTLPLAKLHNCFGCGQRYRDTDANIVNPGDRLEARCCPHCGRVRFQSWSKEVNSIASVAWGFGRRKWGL